MINLNTKLLSKGAKHIKIRSIGSDGKTESKDSECILFKNFESVDKPSTVNNFELNNTINLTSSEPSNENFLNINEKVSEDEK